MLEAIFSETITTVTLTGLTQWDYGQKLYIKGLDLPEVIQVHFSNDKEKEAIVRVATKQGEYTVVDIPNELLEKYYDISAWVYVIGENSGETIKVIYLKVDSRIKPQDFISHNPTAEDILAKAIEKMNETLADNKQFKVEITESEKLRVEAEQGRVNAENERVQAEIQRANAEQLRANAENERANAEALRDEAETQRASAEQLRTNAENERVQAEQGRVNAEKSRVSAETDRQNTWNTLKGEIDDLLKQGVINDKDISELKTWSSNKINGITSEHERRLDTLETQGVAVGDTLPIGSTFYFEGTEAELPTGFEKVDVIPPRQLLINNDFQINQRGQSEYTGFATGSYNLDMWKNWFGSSTTKSVKQVENGVDIYGDKTIALEQFANYKNGIGKTFSIGCSFDNKRYEFTFTLTDTSQPLVIKENVNISVKYEVENKRISIALWCNDGVKHTVNYIDLFEGDIAYPHVKKSYHDSLMECFKYYVGNDYAVSIGCLYKTWEENRGNTLYKDVILPTVMIGKPIIDMSFVKVYCNDKEEVYMPEELDVNAGLYKGTTIAIRIKKKDKTAFSGNSYSLQSLKISISCEPL